MNGRVRRARLEGCDESRSCIEPLAGAVVVAHRGGRALLRGICLVLATLWFVLVDSSVAHASPVSLQGRATLSASPSRLSGEITLQLSAQEAIYNASVVLIESGATHVFGSVSLWPPGSEQHFSLSVPVAHALPGDYHALVQVDFQDQAGAWLSVALGFPYRVVSSRPARHVPSVTFLRDHVEWNLSGLAPDSAKLDLSSGPAWRLADAPLSTRDRRIAFTPVQGRPALPHTSYPQLARLSWVEEGIHHSVLLPWTLRTEARGHWKASAPGAAAGTAWREAGLVWAVTLVLAVLAIVGGGLRFRLEGRAGIGLAADPPVRRLLGWLIVMLPVGWMASHTRPDLWLTPTWPTGGDIASHVFYAKVFAGWLGQGKISGWLPESFAGFPAFSYYFPLPFILIGVLSHLVGIQPAIKVVAMLPAFLLPFATYLMGTLLRWPVAVRVLGAAGAGGSILAGGNSIWGGNVLSELSGEFAYGWGMAAVVCFWGVLAQSLRCGGRWWILAGVVEALAALCHGYALLMAGFGAFVVWLAYGGTWRGLRAVLQVHLLAFLLIGFWLLPLFETAPWTIPNDTAFVLTDWGVLWPTALWPFALALPLAPVAFRHIPESRSSFAMLAGLGLLGFLGFIAGPRLGLADIRFFPYGQWAAAVLLGVALGWALVAWNRAPLWWGAALSAALVAWWQPSTSTMEQWARWNLEGYESKAMWPVYQELAGTLKGPLDAPRVVFEHDPENNDLGSTRTLEALPLFGSRPVLEGLYMESAISGPFIYQLQAEVSERPSSPLARYPSRKGSPHDAEQHMRELYADTLVLRSKAMKERFARDARFRRVATVGPFDVLQLRDFGVSLVEPLVTPVRPEPRDHWLDRAFRRFLLDYPYKTREVYLGAGEPAPDCSAPKGSPVRQGSGLARRTVHLLRMDREHLVFETDAVGYPHIVRMSYHPKWRSTTGEHIYLAEPCFMLLVPRHSHIELVYGTRWEDIIGRVLSVLAVGLMVLLLSSRRLGGLKAAGPVESESLRLRPFAVFVLFALAMAAWAAWSSPERVYGQGHRALAAQHWEAAGRSFDAAFAGRHGPARRAEALFWAARSYQYGDRLDAAGRRYLELVRSYPESYWAPESLYRLAEIARRKGEIEETLRLSRRLLGEFPDSPWATKAKELLERPAR